MGPSNASINYKKDSGRNRNYRITKGNGKFLVPEQDIIIIKIDLRAICILLKLFQRGKHMKDLNPIAMKRTLRGWNAHDLAFVSGISAGMVRHYESGEHFPTNEKLKVLCKTLSVEFNDLKAELQNWHDRKRPAATK